MSTQGRLQHGRRRDGRGHCPMSAALAHNMDLSWWETPSGISCELVARIRFTFCRLDGVILGRPKFLDACPTSKQRRSMQTVHPLHAAPRDRCKCGNGVMSGNWKASDPIVPWGEGRSRWFRRRPQTEPRHRAASMQCGMQDHAWGAQSPRAERGRRGTAWASPPRGAGEGRSSALPQT
jgi:hypothetical protein